MYKTRDTDVELVMSLQNPLLLYRTARREKLCIYSVKCNIEDMIYYAMIS